jgi:ATP-binding cassette subfamily F protein 3
VLVKFADWIILSDQFHSHPLLISKAVAVLIQVRGAQKRYGDQLLLDDAELSLVDDVKVGFIGRNGAGKSTLLRVLLGDEELEMGELALHPSLRIGYLRQHDPFQTGESALNFLVRDSGQPEWRCGEVAGQFELKGAYLDGPVKELSGGWQTRVKLAALLLHDPNLLMLDEPTNFLDLRTQILLEHFLRDFNKAALIVSHDRAFLRSTCSQTLEISRGKLTMFPGKIDAYLENREERREHDRRVNATVIAKQKQLKKFIDKNRANASTASQARSKTKQLERLQTTELEVDEATAHIRAPRVEPRSGTAVRCESLAMGYGDHTVADAISLEIEHGERAAIVGDNGQGKTTLLRTLVDSLEPLAGSVKWGYGVEIGTYAQHVYTSLDERQTVLEHLEYTSDSNTTRQDLLAMAGALLFRDDHIHKKIKVLSGGERARLCMAGLLLGTANVMVLDEPGNHLDVETVEALADALLQYKGTVVFTSHDRHFMHRVATSVIEVRDGGVKNYFGNYDTYLQSVEQEVDAGERERAAQAKGTDAGPPKPKSIDHRENQRSQRKAAKEVRNLERKIARLDEEKHAINDRLMNESDPQEAMRLHEQMTKIGDELASAEDRWMELSCEE